MSYQFIEAYPLKCLVHSLQGRMLVNLNEVSFQNNIYTVADPLAYIPLLKMCPEDLEADPSAGAEFGLFESVSATVS